jgi:GNAT superfamily N-acetyltransferase
MTRSHIESGTGDSEYIDSELVCLRDGSSVSISQATAEDEPELRSFLEGLCSEARRLRFFSGAADIASAAHLTAIVDERHVGLVAHDGAGGLVGHAIYIQLDDARAEVAVEVADALHGCGLGTVLIERLAKIAEERGIERFVAEVLPDNHAMLDVFRDGFDAHLAFHYGVEAVELPTAAWRLVRKRFDAAAGQAPPVLISPRSSA